MSDASDAFVRNNFRRVNGGLNLRSVVAEHYDGNQPQSSPIQQPIGIERDIFSFDESSHRIAREEPFSQFITVPPNSQKSHVYSGFTRLTAFTAHSNKHEASITFFVNENQLQSPLILEENNVMHASFDLPLNSSDKIKVTIKNPNIQPLSISLTLFGFGIAPSILGFPLDDKPLPFKPEPEKNWRIEGLLE